MRLLVLCWIVLAGFSIDASAQLACLNCSAHDTTSYTNGYENDSLFFICQGQNAALRVLWPGNEPMNVQWYRFISTTNTWLPITNQQQVAQGTYTAANGGFRAVVTNNAGETILDERCWVSRVVVPPIVNANTIQPGCSAVQLAGLFWTGNVGGYYNPPPANFYDSYVFSDNTEIEVCLDIQHPIMADLRIELVAPPECGSAVVILTTAQTPLEVDTVCYNEDATNLCFNNVSQENYYLCDLPFFDITGDFGSFGPAEQTIDWSPLLGCDVTLPGWQLNVFDCYEGAQGVVSDATITISDDSFFAAPYSQVYEPASGQDLSIPDQGCNDSLFLSILFERNYPHSTFLSQNIDVVWEANPPVDFMGQQNELYITLSNGPQQDTYFTFSLTNIQLGDACGTSGSDVEFYDYIAPDSAVIALSDSILCIGDSPLLLTSSFEDGTWNGPIESSPDGALFNPSSVGEGEWVVSFEPNSACIQPTQVQIAVEAIPQITFSSVDALCSTDSIIHLVASPAGGEWAGMGIVDSLTGAFNPSVVDGEGVDLSYSLSGNCPTQSSISLEIETYVPLQILQSDTTAMCENDEVLNFASNLSSVLWIGNGITSSSGSVFHPEWAGVGLHQIVALYHQACTSADTAWVRVDDPSIQFVQPSPVCVSGDTVFLGVTAAPGQWSGLGIIDSIMGNVDPTVLGPGNHFFTYTLFNACASIDSISMSVQDFPDIDLGLPDGICIDQPAFAVQANYPGGQFSGLGIEGIVGQELFNPFSAGVGLAAVNYAYADVCALTVTDTIEVFPLPQLILSADTAICPGGEAAIGAAGASSYSWSPAASVQNAQQASTIALPQQTTSYAVIGQSADGCYATAELTIEVYDAPVVTTNAPLEICPGESDILVVDGLQSVQWTGPAVDSPQDISTLVSPAETSLYTVSGTDEHGCAGEAVAEVIVNQPMALFSASDTLGIPPLTVEFTNLSQGDYFVWVLGNGDTLITTALSEIPQAVYDGEQVHTVTLTAYLGGCPDTYSMQVVTYYDSELLIIPNVVTPNGDSKNDVWKVKTQNMKELHADIFDRWGVRVGELEGIYDQWSPGEAADGSYFYRLTAVGLDGESYNHEGTFTVLRADN
jgi:gliding motility-associated-like protein